MRLAGDSEIHLLLEPHERVSPGRILVDGLGSLLVHLGALVFLTFALNSDSPVRYAPGITVNLARSIPLYVPQELTQKEDNRGKITHELDVRSAPPPAPVPQAPRFRAPQPRPSPAPPPAPEIEAPKVEAALTAPPPVPSAGQSSNPLPDKPKLAFENVGAGGSSSQPNPNPNPKFKLPDPRLSALNASIQPQVSHNGVEVGDLDEMTTLASPDGTPAPGPVRSNLQLLSDPKGVDFKPYLIRVLAAVRVNWLSVIPESARMGLPGRVLVQFIIDRHGGVPKLVIAEPSGTTAFDRAAVAGISASNPFPPLPSNFKGDEIRLQLAFSYNLPAR